MSACFVHIPPQNTAARCTGSFAKASFVGGQHLLVRSHNGAQPEWCTVAEVRSVHADPPIRRSVVSLIPSSAPAPGTAPAIIVVVPLFCFPLLQPTPSLAPFLPRLSPLSFPSQIGRREIRVKWLDDEWEDSGFKLKELASRVEAIGTYDATLSPIEPKAEPAMSWHAYGGASARTPVTPVTPAAVATCHPREQTSQPHLHLIS